MSAYKKSGYTLLSLTLAIGCLLAVFAVMDASSARAGDRQTPSTTELQPSIVVTPSELQATLYPDELDTQTLWITNTGDSPLSFIIYEMTTTLRLEGYTLLPVASPVVDPEAQAQISAQGSALVLIFLRQLPDLSPAYAIPDRTARAQYVYDRLADTAALSADLYTWLESQGTQPRHLLIANAIAATLDEAQLASVARNPQVRSITPNRQFKLVPEAPTPLIGPLLPTTAAMAPDAVEWNIAKIRADEAWSMLGITGEGAVVGIVDTGVLYSHSALVSSYRGNLGGGNFDHNYNWFDFVNGNPVPYDDNGHGTMITGIVSGDDGAGNQIGVAPGADWIAAKACNGGGGCSQVDLIAALDWMLAPTDLTGANPDPAKAPQVVFGGWGSAGCDNFFAPYISALRSAGILPIFSSGGGGPSCNSMGSPADLPQVLATGATDTNDLIATFSPRGPSCYAEIKPDVVAPGVNVRSSFPPNTYQVWSGTAESSAHAAGVAALILSANPSLGPDDVEDILYATALCIDNLTCGGDACPEPNNVYGHGRIDAYEAVYAALGYPQRVDLPWLSESPITGTLAAGDGIAIEVTFDTTGLAEGTYVGALGIVNSDPNQHFVPVPVTLTVLAPCDPLADLAAEFTPITPTVGELVTFTASASGTGPITYDWDFGDGSTATGEVVTHVFTSVDTHVVTLTATNPCGTLSMELDVPVVAGVYRYSLPMINK
jgi:subtilisin family serine protease